MFDFLSRTPRHESSNTHTQLHEQILLAADKLTTNIMIANADGVIIYMNAAMHDMMKKCEAEIRKDLPSFSADKVIGGTYDVFYKDPAHQRRLIENMENLFTTSITIGEYIFNLLANPLHNDKGERIGTAVEWQNNIDRAQVEAINRSQAVIEFELDGTIIKANDNFLNAMGYTLAEVKGKHHRIFVAPKEANSDAYADFWKRLERGEFFSGEFHRIAKDGSDVWIQASYNPIIGMNGKVLRIIKYATDITEQKQLAADQAGQIEAIHKSQAVIEFNMDSTIITANDNFLNAMGYTLDEVKGKKHRIFVDPEEAASAEYAELWDKLRRGEYDSRVYRRIAKDGSDVWIQASYNPILDSTGKPHKVVKYASDVTHAIQTSDIAEGVAANVQSVAAAVEEMSASISEISGNMARSTQATAGIMSDTEASSAAASQLTSSMQAMEGVVDLISNIAGQVNLLALNATIEAARAGEAGRGFAVVATEVKNLADQTTKATEDIARQIQQLQDVAGSVSNSVENISKSAAQVNEYVTSVASAVEEQGAVTGEISQNTQQVAQSMDDIVRRIRSLSEA